MGFDFEYEQVQGIKCILLDNPLDLKVFCHALVAMQGYWRNLRVEKR